MKTVLLSDATLRDGNHAIGHTLTAEQIAIYCQAIDETGIAIVEVVMAMVLVHPLYN